MANEAVMRSLIDSIGAMVAFWDFAVMLDDAIVGQSSLKPAIVISLGNPAR